MKTSKNGINIIKVFEGIKDGNTITKGIFEPYQDIVGVWTIGYGSTFLADGTRVVKNTKGLTEAECADLLAITLKDYEKPVNELCAAYPLKQNQFDALVSLCYNIGARNFRSSTIYRKIMSGELPNMTNFVAWNKAGGKVVQGLTNRRTLEWSLFNQK